LDIFWEMKMGDRGLAALAAALHPFTCFDHPDGAHIPPLCGTRAAAILGERAVFWPAGLEEYRELIHQYQASIATLRAALDGLVVAVEAFSHPTYDYLDEISALTEEGEREVDAIRAALATAKEAGG
jgi:hypothetical protein